MLSNSSPAATKYRSEAIETAVEQVLAFGRSLLEEAPEQLLGLVERQARQLLQQQPELEAYEQQVAALSDEVRVLKAEQHIGSVAPFRIDERKREPSPKQPGRKPGHTGRWRQSPPPSERDEHIEVPLALCPDCGHDLAVGNQRVIEQTIIEAPVVEPRIIRLRTYRNHCSQCDKQVSSHHPLQVSSATGAAGTHLGPRALGLAAMLNKELQASLSVERIQTLRQSLETRFAQLLAMPRPPDAQRQQEEKGRNRLRKQQDHLFTFLDHPAVDATNNLVT